VEREKEQVAVNSGKAGKTFPNRLSWEWGGKREWGFCQGSWGQGTDARSFGPAIQPDKILGGTGKLLAKMLGGSFLFGHTLLKNFLPVSISLFDRKIGYAPAFFTVGAGSKKKEGCCESGAGVYQREVTRAIGNWKTGWSGTKAYRQGKRSCKK